MMPKWRRRPNAAPVATPPCGPGPTLGRAAIFSRLATHVDDASEPSWSLDSSPQRFASSGGDARMAVGVGVAALEEGDSAAAALVGGDGGEAPLVAAGKEPPPPPADGVSAVEEEGKGAEAPLEGGPAVITAEREGDPHKAEDKEDAEAADGVPAVEVEGKGAAAPSEGAPAVITVEGEEEEGHKAEGKEEAAAEEEEGHKAEDKKEAAEEEEEDEVEKRVGHYSSGQHILIVGDGDFSFSLVLATAFGSGANLVATSLDTYEALKGKYSKAESNIMEMKRLGATVLHGVDAKKMRFHTDLMKSRFDRIVFNFPHAGFKGKEDDMHMINLHKQLLWGFFINARHLVRRYGEIHVNHKTGHPYDRWDLEHLSAGSSLAMVEKVAFRKEDYPGYNQKRGDSVRCDEPFDLGACCTFKFQIGDLKKLKKMNGKRAGSIPSHPGHWVTDQGPFHPLPPFEAWPWQHFPPPDKTGGMLMPPPPYIADQRPQPGFPPNSDDMVRAPYFHPHNSFIPMVSMPRPWLNALPDPGGIHQQDNFHPMVSMPGPWPNAFPPPGGIPLPPAGGVPPLPMGRIPWPDLHAPQEQHWYQQRTVPDQLRGDNYFPAGSFNHSAFFEHQHLDRESVQKLEWMRRMIAQYGRP
ncbi:unnamed protein product [Urochloa decumbens]|uniref:25S rRNA (uridine-N(3))-methyltransferase BMT5-like domain-containing protein n=1 Tax=Urochloa decumbens TaxID=240449 RepID=A0ABC9FG11_9POAL